MESTKMWRIVRIASSALLMLLILASIVGMLFLGVGVSNADRTGTFNLFGSSYHLNKSDAMSPDIEKDELVVVRHQAFTSLKVGDLAAFYVEIPSSSGTVEEQLVIRRITGVDGITYTVTDNNGSEMKITADSVRFLGKADSKSSAFGKAVLFLQSEDGKSIFMGWAVGVTIFLIGLTVLIHVLWRFLVHPAGPKLDGPADALTGEPLDFDEPVRLNRSGENDA